MHGALLTPPQIGLGLRARAQLGHWSGGELVDLSGGEPKQRLAEWLARVRQPLFVVDNGNTDEGRTDGLLALGDLALGVGGHAVLGGSEQGVRATPDSRPLRAVVPAVGPEDLGDPAFRAAHSVRFAYVAGAMANGIASADLVEAMAHEGMLAFYGAAGLDPQTVEQAIDRIASRVGAATWGANLIHSPSEPALEEAVTSLYLRRNVRLVSASAYLRLTLPLVRYRLSGIQRGENGAPVLRNRVMAKVSRVEVARQFLAPAPEALVRELLSQGEIDDFQAEASQRLPMCDDLTVEADSGGHTDNRPAIALLPTMLALRDQLQREHGSEEMVRVGLAGGISTPWSALGAYAMGAAYVLVGSVNQACVESGSSDLVREMLAETEQADVAMAPAADMFEMGVELQVLKRGTLFPMRAKKLGELYRSYESLEQIPQAEREQIERTIFRLPLEEVWRDTEQFWQQRDEKQLERAAREPRHRMALLFRWYLGQSSRWANAGIEERKADFQVWCGPSMGAFNEWARGSFLENASERRVTTVAKNMLWGAAVLSRANAFPAAGLPWPAPDVAPRSVAQLEELLA